MYYPREEKRDFLQTISTLSLIAIIPLALLALLSSQGAAVTLIALNKSHVQAIIVTLNKFPDQGVEFVNYNYAINGRSFSDTYTQYKKKDSAAYDAGDSLAIVHSAFFPAVNLPETTYASGQTDGKIFTGCLAASLFLLGLSFFALIRQRKHAAEDVYY